MGNDPSPFSLVSDIICAGLFFFSLFLLSTRGNKISPAKFVISPLFSVLAIAGPLAWPRLVYDVANQGNERVSLGWTYGVHRVLSSTIVVIATNPRRAVFVFLSFLIPSCPSPLGQTVGVRERN